MITSIFLSINKNFVVLNHKKPPLSLRLINLKHSHQSISSTDYKHSVIVREVNRINLTRQNYKWHKNGLLLFDLSNSFTSFEFEPPAIIMSLFFLLNWQAYKKQGAFDTLIPSQSRVSFNWHFLDSHC